MVTYPAALDLPHAIVALVYLRKHDTLAQIAAGLTQALRNADAEYVPVDGTLAECDRVGDGRADYSGKHRRHGVNHQVITGPDGRLVWVPQELPGRTHDLTAARTHRIGKTCVRLRVPALADVAYTGAGGTFAVPAGRKPGQEPTAGQRSLNRADARFRYPVERGVATLKRWRIFRHARCSPNWLTPAAKPSSSWSCTAEKAHCLRPCLPHRTVSGAGPPLGVAPEGPRPDGHRRGLPTSGGLQM